jgi:carboxyl-terminal processing protease
LGLVACSAKAPATGETRPVSAPEVKPAEAAPVPPPDPREAALAAAVTQLFEKQHLLRKPIDDELSRTAFATYLDKLDVSKMFLLRKDRDALAKYADKIDDELHSGSLELAHEGSRIYVERVGVVEKEVAELLAQPLDHTDEEWIELDPKKVEVAATEAELRDRWKRRLELEVLERVASMETRLDADAKAKAKKPALKPHGKPIDAKPAKPGDPKADDAKDDDDDAPATPLSKIPPTPEGRDAKARADLAKSYAARFTRLRHPGPFDAASELINAVGQTLDPHTDYLPPADKANFDIRMSGSLEGIGAVLREKDDYVEVADIVPGGASARHGGIAVGDLILSVQAEGAEPVDTVDMRLDDVVKMVRGPKGTVVHLRLQKPTGTQETVAITRDVVIVEETYARGAIVTPAAHKGPAFGYIHLPSFYGGRGPGQRTAAGDVRKLLTEMKAKKVAGVVLDIRSNGGGFLGDAIEMTGALIDQGPVVQVQDNRGHREVLADDEPGEAFDRPVVVLVDRFSASASEIVAAALQDYHRAVIVGTGPTHGKGTVQTLADLDRMTGGKIELGSLKITVQQFFRVSGSSTQREGVTPDVLLPDPQAHIEAGERSLDHAIPWSKIAPAPHGDWPVTWKVPQLAEKSAVRVAKQPVLAKIAALTQVLKASREDTRLPLAKPAWEAHRKTQRDAIDAASPNLKAGPALLTVKGMDDAAQASGPADDRLARWRDGVARDPWIEESINVLADMSR